MGKFSQELLINFVKIMYAYIHIFLFFNQDPNVFLQYFVSSKFKS